MAAATGRAYPRVGLLGNPSDIYGGKALALTFEDFAAEVSITPSATLQITGGAEPLIEALLRRFRRCFDLAEPALRIDVRSTIPRQVGLSGSSAIIIAALRALMAHTGHALTPLSQAELALKAETEELGMVAGPLDRLSQVFAGLIFMDCAAPFRESAVERLPLASLPPLFIAWDPSPGQSSGAIHQTVRERWQEGDEKVRGVIAALPALAERGRRCLEQGHSEELGKLVDENFDLRASIFDIGERDRELIEIGRALGAATKFCGSGGAIVGVLRASSSYPELAAAYRERGYEVLRPRLGEDPIS